MPNRFTETPIPPRMKHTVPPGARLFRFRAKDTPGNTDGGVIVSRDDGRLHLSISLPHRLPTWEEMTEARKQLLPRDAFFCVPFPPEKYWMSVHPYAMHLYELQDETLISLWTEIGEAMGNSRQAGDGPKGRR